MSDSNEFENLAMEYMDQLYSTAKYWTRSEADAADLVQETYLRAFKGFGGFEKGTNLRAWLFRIMKNAHLNMIRKEKTSPQTQDVEEEVAINLSPTNASYLDTLTSKQVEDAISELPQSQKEALLLVELEGFSYKEAADILSIPVGTIMSRLSRARKTLANVLYEYVRKENLITKDTENDKHSGNDKHSEKEVLQKKIEAP